MAEPSNNDLAQAIQDLRSTVSALQDELNALREEVRNGAPSVPSTSAPVTVLAPLATSEADVTTDPSVLPEGSPPLRRQDAVINPSDTPPSGDPDTQSGGDGFNTKGFKIDSAILGSL
jgi:hypothetical protein